MAFPVSPNNGDRHGNYEYDATNALWKVYIDNTAYMPSGTKNIAVGGVDTSFYPIIVPRGFDDTIVIDKSVHDGGSWDGNCRMIAKTSRYAWGGYENTQWVLYNTYTTKQFVADVGITANSGTYMVIWLRGARNYTFRSAEGHVLGGPFYASESLTNNGTVAPRTDAPLGSVDRIT